MMRWQRIIQAEAKKQKLSGYRIAKMCGVPMRTVQAFLAGSSDLSSQRLEKIAEALGLDLCKVRRKRKGSE